MLSLFLEFQLLVDLDILLKGRQLGNHQLGIFLKELIGDTRCHEGIPDHLVMVLPARLEFLDLLSGHRTDEVPILSHVLDDLLVASHPSYFPW